MYIIADIGLNHNGSFQRTLNQIMKAKTSGFDCVKFQMYDPNFVSDENTRSLLTRCMFMAEWLPDISDYCKSMGIDFAITPFYPEAVQIITPYVDWIKIGSYEIAYQALIEAVADSGKNVIMSTGMAIDLGEIYSAIRRIGRDRVSLLYCVCKYPSTIEDINMNNIPMLYNGFNSEVAPGSIVQVGYSDHSKNPNVITAALYAEAPILEMHFDMDGDGLEYNIGHVWIAEEAFDLINGIREAESCFKDSNPWIPDFSKRTNNEGKRT